MSTRHPEILWAQRSDKIFLTVELPDAKNAQVQLEPDGRFTFTATAKDAQYATEMQLYGRVKVDESEINEGRRHTFCVIPKEEKGWWARLLKDGKAPPFVKADWNRWIDEDEEEDGDAMDDLNMNRSMNMDDIPQLEPTEDSDDDDDDDEVPDLQKAEA
jgi:prostaglandin-E synthase